MKKPDIADKMRKAANLALKGVLGFKSAMETIDQQNKKIDQLLNQWKI